jgi:hypothetical protein
MRRRRRRRRRRRTTTTTTTTRTTSERDRGGCGVRAEGREGQSQGQADLGNYTAQRRRV